MMTTAIVLSVLWILWEFWRAPIMVEDNEPPSDSTAGRLNGQPPRGRAGGVDATLRAGGPSRGAGAAAEGVSGRD